MLAITNCGSRNNEQIKLQSILKDDSRTREADVRLKNAIGSLKDENGLICSAFIINYNELVTARHCIDLHQPLNQYYFENSFGQKIKLTQINESLAQADIISFQISTQVFTLISGTFNPTSGATITGVDPHNKLVSSEECKVQENTMANGFFEYVCDTESGQSGSPILQNGLVIGIHLGNNPHKNVNIGVSLVSKNSADINNIAPYEPEWGKKKVHFCGDQYIKVNALLAATCGGALGTVIGVCPAYVTTLGLDPISGSVCALALTTASWSCSVSIGGLTSMLIGCIAEKF